MSQFLKYVDTKPTLVMHFLHNLHGQLHDFIVSLNVDRDGASLIFAGTNFHN